MNKMRILVTFANQYDIQDDRNSVKGMTLNYFFFGDHGEAFKSMNDLNGGAVGYQRAKCSMDYSMRDKIKFVPGVYDAEMVMTVGSDGKPSLKVSDLEFVGQVNVQLASQK